MSGAPTGRPEAGIAEVFAEQLRLIAQARSRNQRGKALDQLAQSVRLSSSALPFLNRLASRDRHGQRLALEIASRLEAPLGEPLCRLLIPLTADAHFPLPLRLVVGSLILRSSPPEAAIAGDLLSATIQGMKPYRAAERLRLLQQRLPNHPRIERLIHDLEQESAIPCPRCGLRLQRPELVVHLWQAHHLLMAGKLARDPWKMIEDWLREYARTGLKDMLERSCELGRQLDPEGGLTEVHRLLLAVGLTDEEASNHLKRLAKGRRASLCPHCYALVPRERDELPSPLKLGSGQLVSHGYKVKVTDRYLFSSLQVGTPTDVLYDGIDPTQGMTRRGSVILQVGPLVFAAFVLALFLPLSMLPPLTPVALILLAAFLIFLRIRSRRRASGDPTDRVIDQAWRLLVPEFHRPVFSRDQAAFLGRLALTSIGRGTPAAREEVLERMAHASQPEIAQGQLSTGDLAALHCLEMDDAIRLGRDPVAILVKELGACLAGETPLACGEQLLEAWPVESRDQGQRARLRVLLCAQAFELAFEPGDLHELGRLSEQFGLAFSSEDKAGLSRLRWLWQARPTRPWQALGATTTVFDLARYPALGGQYLEDHPDLLLFQPMSIGKRGDPILICERGIVYRNLILYDPAIAISFRPRSIISGGFEVIAGKQKLVLADDPAPLVRRLQGWLRILFQGILPAARPFVGTRGEDRLRLFVRQKTNQCPECGHAFLAQSGEVGIPTDVV